MANVALNDIVLMGYRSTCFGQRILFNLTYRVDEITAGPIDTTEFSLAAAQSLVDGGASAVWEEYQNVISSNVTVNWSFAQIVKAERYRRQTAIIGTPGAGTATTTANVNAVMTRFSERSGRDQVSNNHPGPIPTTASVSGILTDVFKAEVGDLAAICCTPITLAGIGVVIVPTIWHSRAPGPTVLWDDIVDGYAQDQTRVMTRRTVGRGE